MLRLIRIGYLLLLGSEKYWRLVAHHAGRTKIGG
ncbi:hypothetical protein Gbem_1210 [Citrifermentans bemidjiense Bem]|uniref:Uncharacterized protein n=1 Tax=Citrifermentans bemidjiense (strain ATCC BAA-1014 / DSM 16622 / JCM 12645 / Bem) TaxID=404380 RepID=B5EHL9_CITBB|nr:hypothetical protein Gbem_1210 [Citrifermentans bemidjiense Bem]